VPVPDQTEHSTSAPTKSSRRCAKHSGAMITF
jgi:hypothetical protein